MLCLSVGVKVSYIYCIVTFIYWTNDLISLNTAVTLQNVLIRSMQV